ncbi:MAG TPA: hypothetical protein VK915_10470 [Gaiellaceae bacterium]|nr:hypothetical protein [Gaiellaceae bacterium]
MAVASLRFHAERRSVAVGSGANGAGDPGAAAATVFVLLLGLGFLALAFAAIPAAALRSVSSRLEERRGDIGLAATLLLALAAVSFILLAA